MTGKELKNWRAKAGLTQAQLAEQLGVTSNTVARWERDEISIPPHINSAAITKSPQAYILRIMRENGLTSRQVAERASRFGHRIGTAAVQMMVLGSTANPGIYTVKALAVGLGRPEEEVFAAFGVGEKSVKLKDSELEAIQLNYSHLSRDKQKQLRPFIDMLSREIQRQLSQQD